MSYLQTYLQLKILRILAVILNFRFLKKIFVGCACHRAIVPSWVFRGSKIFPHEHFVGRRSMMARNPRNLAHSIYNV